MSIKKPRGDERGFTLIELLVVILIIGVLAAIAIPLFLSQAAKAHDVSASSSLSTAQLAVEIYRTDHNTNCGIAVADLVAIEPTLVQEPSLAVSTCAGGDSTSYALSVTSDAIPPTSFTLARSHGVDTRTCSPAGRGRCHANGSW